MSSPADVVRDRYRAAIADAHRAETLSRHRPAIKLSVSRLGGCTRRAAYTLAGTEPSNQVTPGEARAANHGTWIHEGVLPRLADQVGGKHETQVVVTAAGVTIYGRADLAVTESDLGGEMLDVKTVAGLDGVRRRGGWDNDWMQLLAYILGETQRSGQRIRWAVLLYIDRDTGEDEVFVREVTDAVLLSVVERVAEIRRYSAAPDMAPRTTAALPGSRRWRMRGPGSWTCDECPWLSRCWPGAEPGVVGAQRHLARTDPAREAAIGAYASAATAAGELSAEQSFWRSVLAGAPEGEYGPWRLSWTRNGAINVKAIRPIEGAQS